MSAWGVRIIAAGSAQAKGRVERNHGTHQDRLIKKLRRKKVATHAAANEFLKQVYLPEHNRRFARPPAAKEDYHRPKPSKRALDELFRIETERTLGNDWVVRHNNRFYQVERESSYAPARSKVTICQWEDGRLEIRYRSKRLAYEEIVERPAKKAESAVLAHGHHRPKPPSASHPWRQAYQEMHPRAERSNETE